MKDKLINFGSTFALCFALMYFFGSDRDLAWMIFYSAFMGLFILLTDRIFRKFVVTMVKKIVKPK